MNATVDEKPAEEIAAVSERDAASALQAKKAKPERVAEEAGAKEAEPQSTAKHVASVRTAEQREDDCALVV